MCIENTNILLVDGVCNLCNAVVKFIIKRDKHKKFKFTFLQSERGKALLEKFALPLNDLDTFVYITGNTYYVKSSAALHVLKELGGIWKCAYVFIIFPKPFRDFFYQLIAKTRYKVFGKKESCMIPDPDIQSRFIL